MDGPLGFGRHKGSDRWTQLGPEVQRHRGASAEHHLVQERTTTWGTTPPRSTYPVLVQVPYLTYNWFVLCCPFVLPVLSNWLFQALWRQSVGVVIILLSVKTWKEKLRLLNIIFEGGPKGEATVSCELHRLSSFLIWTRNSERVKTDQKFWTYQYEPGILNVSTLNGNTICVIC